MSNSLLRFHIQNTPVRGEWIELSDAWQQVVSRHAVDQTSLSMLGQLTAASLLLSATIKHQGSLTAQIVGDGPVTLIVAQCQANGTFRSTIKLSEKHPMPAEAEPDVSRLINPGGKARFAITIDPREEGKTAYQGIVPLEGNSIARMLERYMFRSEQIPTRLWLAANRERATGLLLQRLPDPKRDAGQEHDTDAWARLQKLAETLGADEMLAENGETILHRLFWQEQTGPLESRPLRFECPCSRQKVNAMLQMLGAAEVQSILAEQGQVAVNCEYCNTPYLFDPVDVAGLFKPGALPGTDTRQ
ncbi:MAG: Hsp33 family molecular chaperone HslO [Burkholderiaceae bacterium]